MFPYDDLRKLDVICKDLSAEEARLFRIKYFFSLRQVYVTLHETPENIPNEILQKVDKLLIFWPKYASKCDITYTKENTEVIFGIETFTHYEFFTYIVNERPCPFLDFLVIRRKRDNMCVIVDFGWWVREFFVKGVNSPNYTCWLALQGFKFLMGEDIDWAEDW